MHNGADNRLSSAFLTHCLAKALDIVESDWRAGNGDEPGGSGALIISGKHDQEKFFSNGAAIKGLTCLIFIRMHAKVSLCVI